MISAVNELYLYLLNFSQQYKHIIHDISSFKQNQNIVQLQQLYY